MKKTLSIAAISALLMTTACTKQGHGSDDLVPQSSQSGQGVEDNPNGGGGNNVNAATVPAAVLAAFNARYPDAMRIEWKKQSDGTFKAEFFRGTVKWQAIFTADGRLIKEEHQ
ncbi:MAG TPA: hypothetical protein VNR87_01505 [Flavisolibacter sp.]|nr:hypothetical protein [Flavisolibacter sp.]